jgi:hypothetical protein
MNRLTERDEYGNADIIGVDSEDIQLNLDFEGFNRVIEALNRLAAYEDTELEPEEVEAAKEIAARLALADYPHDFQRERADIVSYMHWITSVMKEAKAWWEKLIEAREDAEKALEGMNNDER